ncbi:succinate dehydrogenase/fumarate reductase iron-sulfur subunit [compost metagenome]
MVDEGKLKPADGNIFQGKKITYHDPCYLGRANEVYEAPRKVLESLDAQLIELKRCKSNGLCCGAGGGQMFKEPEKGTKDVNIERIEEVIDSQATIVAAACPFCMTMLKDGVKIKEKESEIEVLDIAEITVRANNI